MNKLSREEFAKCFRVSEEFDRDRAIMFDLYGIDIMKEIEYLIDKVYDCYLKLEKDEPYPSLEEE